MVSPNRGRTRPGVVRIIGGNWRRHRIAIPAGVDLRPTPDRVRETVFNWLAPHLAGANCLDLFAGTGALAFEALSRGAAHAVLVESSARARAGLEATRDRLGANATIVGAAAESFLARPDGSRFDVVFVDPPYADPVARVFALLPAWLGVGARVYLERERHGPWPQPAGFDWLHRATAGAVDFGLADFGLADLGTPADV
jgi:16S rRNA (guanine966-N2)-methyltransferase